MKKIYLDYAATTAVRPRVLAEMEPYLNHKFGNASSMHLFGQEARGAIDSARANVAKLINSLPEEIIFTSGGTEANNLAIKGLVESFASRPHLIISQIEHQAVLKVVKELEKGGKIEATYLGVDALGRVDPQALKKAIKKNTILISIMYVNSETGVIQPIREIGKIIEKINKKRRHKIYFHSDAVQAAGHFDLNVDYLHLDLMTISAHKIYGPKGVGLLYLRKGTPLVSQMTGGEQENGHRAGTENVAGIVGLAKALSLAASRQLPVASRIRKLRDYFEKKVREEIKGVSINGDLKNRAPHISNLSFNRAEGESILLSLDLEGIAASSGSACTSGSLEPSHVLMAMGISSLLVQSSIRFSLGRENTKEEIDYVVKILKKIIKRLRKMSPI